MSDENFRTAFKGSPMKRAKLRGLKRMAAIVRGNVVTRCIVLADGRSDSAPMGQAIDGRVAAATLESA